MKQTVSSSRARWTAEERTGRRAHWTALVRTAFAKAAFAKNALLCLAAVCLLCTLSGPVRAEGTDSVYTYILDSAGLLESWALDVLEDEASEIASTYGFAPYVVTVDDLYGMTATDLALSYYDEHDMGAGEDREGSILLLSMAGRDFAYEIWDYTNGVFDEYRRDSVQEAFLENFREDDWYGGFCSYLFATKYYLSGEADDVAEGEDYAYYGDYEPDYGRYENGGSGKPSLTTILLVIGVPCVVAGLICAFLAASMESVHPAVYAREYAKGDVKIRVKEDVFTHVTESRVHIEKESSHSSGGGGGGGGGHFSSSGKF